MQKSAILWPPFCTFFEKFFISGTHLLQRHPFWKIILSYIMQKSPLLWPLFWQNIQESLHLAKSSPYVATHHAKFDIFSTYKTQKYVIMAKIRMVMLFVRDLYLKHTSCKNNVKGYPLFGNFEHFMSSFICISDTHLLMCKKEGK